VKGGEGKGGSEEGKKKKKGKVQKLCALQDWSFAVLRPQITTVWKKEGERGGSGKKKKKERKGGRKGKRAERAASSPTWRRGKCHGKKGREEGACKEGGKPCLNSSDSKESKS